MSNKYLYKPSEDIKLILSDGIDSKTAWSLFMIFCAQVNAFVLCLICVDATVREDKCRKEMKTGEVQWLTSGILEVTVKQM